MELNQVVYLQKQIVAKVKERKYDSDLIKSAINEALRLHDGQLRKSGVPYIIHPFSVALEILDLDIGSNAVAAALLHDTIEDCNIDRHYIENKFNPTVADLVEGVTKLDELADNSISRYTELLNLRKFLISSASDIRVLLIKLADRLHNMRTIDALPALKQIDYSDETLKVYVPLAEYIGIGKFKRELEDIAFRKKNPEIYRDIKHKIESDKRIHSNILEGLLKEVEQVLVEQKIKVSTVYGRTKSTHSTYNKLHKQMKEGKLMTIDTLDLSKIKDLLGISIILDADEIECYRVLGLIHAHFEHIPKDFDDYIARPKPNGYRALQTTVLYEGTTAEVQIKTLEMHDVNEFGPASHIAYKISGKRKSQPSSQYSWIRNLTLWHSAAEDEKKYELEAFKDRIFVVTPKGKVIELEKGATPIDFAYAIHSEVGNKFLGAKINGQIAKIDSTLQNGDVVDILTSKSSKMPSQEWIKYAHSTSTKSKIRKFLTLHERDSNIAKGRDSLAEYIDKEIKIDWLTLDSGLIRFVCSEMGNKDVDHLYMGINSGNVSKRDILKLIVKKLNLQRKETTEDEEEAKPETRIPPTSKTNVVIEGVGDLEYKIAGCCKPIKGDEIIGIVTLRDGLKIHRIICPHLEVIDAERKLKAEWV
jgi:GTP diphosphokinase / guanosine-3',5'-bis(diphosphate) 3'-diphosphatase